MMIIVIIAILFIGAIALDTRDRVDEIRRKFDE